MECVIQIYLLVNFHDRSIVIQLGALPVLLCGDSIAMCFMYLSVDFEISTKWKLIFKWFGKFEHLPYLRVQYTVCIV